ncbi:MAG: M23 family metallopeptidase [Actinomycetota bacterium]
MAPTLPERYTPPVAASVVDAFRPPPGGFGAGNRGLEYDTEPGDPVGAIGSGTVAFAGPVGGTLHVTVLHPDGIRSSYSFLESIGVELDDPVARGQRLGWSTDRLHLGIRAGSAYLDPARLFATPPVHLVPVD